MAKSGHRLLLRLSLLLGFLSIAANARPGRHFHPCHTLIFFSTSSPIDRNTNPNFSPQNPSITFSGRRSITFFLTGARVSDPEPTVLPSVPKIYFDRTSFDLPKFDVATIDRTNIGEGNRPLPLGFYSSASVRDRTKDILSVVASLLLGVACGALTAATLYLIWYLFAPNRFNFRDSVVEFDDDVWLKKMGYVGIPAAEKPVKDAAAAPAPAPAKEVV